MKLDFEHGIANRLYRAFAAFMPLRRFPYEPLTLDKSRNAWQDDIRVQKRRDRMPIIWSAIGIAVSIILAIVFT